MMLKGLVFTVMSMVILSCSDDLLEKTPLDLISEEAVFNDVTFLTNYVNGNYRGIKPHFEPDAGGLSGLTDIAIMQDETYQISGAALQYLNGDMTADLVSDLTADLWSVSYDYIRRVNIFFEETAESNIDPERLGVLTGETKFQRAYIYFELLRHFGGVPLLTSSVPLNESLTFEVKRSSYNEVANFVIAELDEAATLLDGVDMPSGRASREAALALKARMLLYMASPLNNPGNDISKWEAAAAAHEAVFAEGFSLHDDYQQLFKEPLKTEEIIFGREYTGPNGTESVAFGLAWGYNYDFWPSGFDAHQKVMPTQRLINKYQMTNGEYPYLDENFTVNPASGYDPQDPFVDRDPRFYVSILYPDAPVNIVDGAKSTTRTYEYWEDANPGIPDENPNKVDPMNGQELFDFGRDSRTYWVEGRTPFHWNIQTGYTFRKLLDFDGPRASVDFDYNYITPWIRLAEMYLNYAEIQLALGDESKARQYINMVRSRASVNMPAISSSGADLERDYRNERAIELLLEDHRFFDLMRWMAGPEYVDINPVNGLDGVTRDWSDGGKFSFSYGPISTTREAWPGDFYYLLPIPRDEINRTSGALEQNPGYQ